MITVVLPTQIFDNWNLPDLLHEVADWICENEINVVSIAFDAYDDAEHPICSTIYRITVSHIPD